MTSGYLPRTGQHPSTSIPMVCLAVAVGIVHLAACGVPRARLSVPELVGKIARNECAGAGLARTPLLVALWTPTDTTYANYPAPEDRAAAGDSPPPLTPATPVQIGALTTSFLVPRLLGELAALGLTLDSVAIPVRRADGTPLRDITFGQLLRHRADLPVYEPPPTGTALDHLLTVDRLLREQDPSEVRGRYRFDHWNYTLAAEAIRTRKSGLPVARPRELAYNDRMPDSLRDALAVSRARAVAPQENQHPELFALSTAGVASTERLIALLHALDAERDTEAPSAPTTADRPNTRIGMGWFVVRLRDGRDVYLNSGQTRRHGAAVAYFPSTRTGVVVTAADSKRLDCLAMDILRNFNNDWRRQPAL